MALSNHERLALDARTPRITRLWFALQQLKSTVSFMQTGAHPDDEHSAMLAALAFRDGMSLSFACAVRGEGGQNDIGTEITRDLGVVRTAEMERAADVLDMRLYWLSETPDDSIFDFGLSKTGTETLGFWDHARVLNRFVDIVRREKPDILCPTFLDIPGQHGHHRAMTQAAFEVFDAAADPNFAGSDLPVWSVSKLYLPAFSGAGGAYDDEVPPPPTTLTVPVRGGDPVTGWSWENIGQQSRAFHRTQGMGRWVPESDEKDRPLHLARTRLSGPDTYLAEGLALTLADHAATAGSAANALCAASDALKRTVAAFPDAAAIQAEATQALDHIQTAKRDCPAELQHRLTLKELQLGRVIRLASGFDIAAHVAEEWLRPGQQTKLTVETRTGSAPARATVELPEGWHRDSDHIGPGPAVGPSDPYPSTYDPLSPPMPRVAVKVGGAVSYIPLLVPPVVLPGHTVRVDPPAVVLNRASGQRSVDVTLSGIAPAGGAVSLEMPDGWSEKPKPDGTSVVLPDAVDPGLYEIPLTVDGQAAFAVTKVAYPHIASRARSCPATLCVRVLDVTIPQVKVGYIGGGSDRVGHWLRAIGVDCTDLTDRDLEDPVRLAKYDSIVVGIFAMRFRTALLAAMPVLKDWAEKGGHLLTLYHRPWDNWDPDKVPPKRLEVGQPSLRWRVTDPAAKVTVLASDHPILNSPNRIDDRDWQDWHKERGLYFAKSWDAAYVPLLEMADPDEAPHSGALLSAEIGKGRHTHCALILHHQMENLVPGAFRLMANLIA